MSDLAFLSRYGQGKSRQERKRLLVVSLQPVYLFVSNDPLSRFDPFGLDIDCGCGRKQGKKAAEEAKKDNPYTDETAKTRDALMHCYVGSRIAHECNVGTATSAGILKEIGDLLKAPLPIIGGDVKDAEWRDIHNTKVGATQCGSESTADGAKSCCEQALDDGLLFPVPDS